MVWDKLANKQTVDKTILALKANGITPYFVSNGEEAKKKYWNPQDLTHFAINL